MAKNKLNGLVLSEIEEKKQADIYEISIKVTEDDNITLSSLNNINKQEISLLLLYGILTSVLKLLELSMSENSVEQG